MVNFPLFLARFVDFSRFSHLGLGYFFNFNSFWVEIRGLFSNLLPSVSKSWSSLLIVSIIGSSCEIGFGLFWVLDLVARTFCSLSPCWLSGEILVLRVLCEEGFDPS